MLTVSFSFAVELKQRMVKASQRCAQENVGFFYPMYTFLYECMPGFGLILCRLRLKGFLLRSVCPGNAMYTTRVVCEIFRGARELQKLECVLAHVVLF